MCVCVYMYIYTYNHTYTNYQKMTACTYLRTSCFVVCFFSVTAQVNKLLDETNSNNRHKFFVGEETVKVKEECEKLQKGVKDLYIYIKFILMSV